VKKILIGIDDSEAALKGARTAQPIVKAYEAQVVLLYVVRPVILPGDAPWIPSDEINAAELKHAERVLEQAAKDLGWPEAERLVKVGTAAETLEDVADQIDASLIVVGSTGKGAVKRLLLGSTADRLVHISSRPVLVVR
jgi:nucleotide-binding universal stress UspA family protein